MSNIDRFSIVTLIFFFLSTIFVIRPVIFYVPLPFVGRTRLTIGLKTAPMLSIAVLWAAQCIGPAQIRDGIVGTDGIKPYNIVILFISLAYMAITLDVTGALQAAAFWVSNKGGSKGRKLYLYFYVSLTLISVVLGNDPIILFATTFLVYYTKATGLEPLPWLISEFAAANTASMVLFVGNPTNVVICEGFRLNNVAFTAYTIFPFIACSLACYGALAFQFHNHIPRGLAVTGKLNVWDVLRDRVSAIFGSILLGICLIVVVVLSFMHVDVWKIVLPFAGLKFIFDLCWDHYRYTTGQIPRPRKSKIRTMASFDAAIIKKMQRALSSATTETPPPGIERRASRATLTSEGSHHQMGFSALDEGGTPVRSSSPESLPSPPPTKIDTPATPTLQTKFDSIHQSLAAHFPTFFTALPRLPFGLMPFAFSQFILIEGLAHQGWIDVFATWLVKATKGQMIPTIWVIGVLGVLLCNVAGTSIGATILLTRVVRAAPNFPHNSTRAAAIALAVASNIGAVNFMFSASLAGLLWKSILKQKGITMTQTMFAVWNMLPLFSMTAVGLAIVTAEMVIVHT